MSWLRRTHGIQFELTRHFLVRMFDGEWSAGGGQWTRTAVSAGALLLPATLVLLRQGTADPGQAGRMRTLAALGSAGCDAYALADQLSLLTLLFSIAGLLALLLWDSLFPSKRDYLALAGYPARPRQIFAARFAAVSLFTVGAAAALSLLPSLLAPAQFAGPCKAAGSYAVNAAAEGAACGLGCLFVAFAIVALQGVLLNVLPGRWFHAATAVAQSALTGAFLLAAIYSFSFRGWSATHIARFQQDGAWMPTLWFAALHRSFRGTPDPLSRRALEAVATALAAAIGTYLLSYHRHRKLLIESPACATRIRGRGGVLTRILARTPRQAAILDFLATTLARSRQHRSIWFAYVGATAAILLNSSMLNGKAFGHSSGWRDTIQFAVLFWPLAASITLLHGFRHVLSVPAELRANWAFRIVESQGRAEWMQAVERFILACVIAPLYLVSTPFAIITLGWPLALRMISLQAVFSLALFEMLFDPWQRLPFTCSYVPGKRALTVIIAGYVAGLGALLPASAVFISVVSRFVPLYGLFLPVFAGVWLWLRRRRREGWGEAPLEYEDLFEAAPNLGIGEVAFGGAPVRPPTAPLARVPVAGAARLPAAP